MLSFQRRQVKHKIATFVAATSALPDGLMAELQNNDAANKLG